MAPSEAWLLAHWIHGQRIALFEAPQYSRCQQVNCVSLAVTAAVVAAATHSHPHRDMPHRPPSACTGGATVLPVTDAQRAYADSAVTALQWSDTLTPPLYHYITRMQICLTMSLS